MYDIVIMLTEMLLKTFFMAGAVRAAIFCPTTVEPVNETMRTWVVVGSSINTWASLGKFR